MYLAPTEHERLIIDSTAQTLAAESPLERWFLPQLDAASEEARLLDLGCRLGWTGMTLHGDASIVDEILLFSEIGRFLGPVALTSATIGALLAQQAGKIDLSAAIARGTAKLAILIGAANAGSTVIGSCAADFGLTIGGDRVGLVRLAAPALPTGSLDWTTTAGRLAHGVNDIVAVLDDERLGLRFLLLVAAQQHGIAQAALTESVAYAKMREQFGRPIGSFQAVRHKCVDMAVRVERSRALLYFAAVALRDERDDAPIQARSASVLAHDAARINSEVNIFIHGAMGVTTENAGHLLLKRAMLWSCLVEPAASTYEVIANAPAPSL